MSFSIRQAGKYRLTKGVFSPKLNSGMRTTLILALAICAQTLAARTDSAPVAEAATARQGADLPALAADFRGKATTAAMEEALQRGASLQSTDSKGNTPLLLLAAAVQNDPRYKTDSALREELHKGIILLLQNGADSLTENNVGCNAVFYLQSDPDLWQKLTMLKLVPRELTIRIPNEEAALSRYMQQRLAQAAYSTNPFSLNYLKRRYCKPAYPRVFDRLKSYLDAETSSLIPTGALQDTLAFLRMADEQAITDYINKLPLWEHGEHFLEEIPERLLVALCELNWDVDIANLEQALHKLESMLPMEEGDMIDCYAAYPMGRILEMMAHKDAEKTTALLNKYTASHDPDMAYTAYRILLQQKKLPLPEPGSLSEHLNLSDGVEALPDTQKRLMECAIVDHAMRQGDLKSVSPDMVERVQGYFREMKLDAFADILTSIMGENRIISPEEGLNEACSAYREAHTTSPRIELARIILAHPELFSHEAS